MSASTQSVSGRFIDKTTSQKRSYALDALRGFAILTMVLSGFIPPELPRWMFHAQVPPPKFVFNPNLPGLTWVDLVFPFFLFSMGAAIPMALTRRIEKGDSYWKIAGGVLLRWVLLMGFALYVSHVSPWGMAGHPSVKTWLLALLGFAVLFPALARFPKTWNPWLQRGVRLGGWIAAILLVALIPHSDGLRFSMDRNDIIIRILADVSVFAAFVWLISQKNILARLAPLGFLMAFRLASPADGWVAWVNAKAQAPMFLGLGVAQYLHIVIPGTIVGDRILEWMKAPEGKNKGGRHWSTPQLGAIVALMLAFFAVELVGLQARWLWQTVLASFAMVGLGYWLVSKPNTSTEKLLKEFFTWGAYCLILGLAFEPYEGGIKKDSATMSYYYVTAGLAIFLLIAFTIIIDVFQKKRALQLLIDNGQNPMIAYIGRSTFVLPVLALTGINPILDKLLPNGWPAFIHGIISTVLVALMVMVFTRRRIFWRT